MKREHILLFASLTIVSSTLSAAPTFADDAYKWTDKKGRIVYGSKPPGEGEESKKIDKNTLSRYSTSKILTRSGFSEQKKVVEEKKALEEAPQLPTESLEIELNEENQVTACSVEVINTTGRKVEEVTVRFDFSPETMIPALGASSLEPGERATYRLPAELIPLTVKGVDAGKLERKTKIVTSAMY